MPSKISCKQFTDFLIRRSEHLDADIIKDITPTDGLIGHVSTGQFDAFDGVEHTFDRINRVFPDLTAPWSDIDVGSCTGTSCDPSETEIGMGATRDSYKLQQKSYKTQLFCFDKVLSADRAKEQFAGLVTSLKEASNIIVSDRIRMEYLRIASNKQSLTLGSGKTPVAITSLTWGSDNVTLTVNAGIVPDSKLTMPALQRWVQPLILNGALGAMPGVPLFTLQTDMETAWELREGNSDLSNKYLFTDFVKGGALYKYGITDAVGNFGIRIDPFPPRFQVAANGTDLVRVYPYSNVAASQVAPGGPAGIKGVVNQTYLDAEVQVSYIWNTMAMRILGRDIRPVNSEMPFAIRDLAGKWTFAMDNLGADSKGCVIANPRRNKGMFLADFEFATKAEHPEWAVAIFHLREQAAITKVARANDNPAYEDESATFSSANSSCSHDVYVDLVAAGGAGWEIAANAITCEGFQVVHPATAALADLAAVVTWLTTNLSELGTFSDAHTATYPRRIKIASANCDTITLPFTADAA